MSDPGSTPSNTQPGAKEDALRQALQKAGDTIRQLLRENAELKKKERIAIIGMACRFPGGANNLEQYWSLLENGKDGVGEVPSDRWPRDAFLSADKNAPGKMYTARGGFIDVPVDQFDAAFFGISPKEANGLDPQQRLLLELSWEALEHAGLVPEKLKFSRTGVYVGLSGDDYARYHRHSGSPEAIDAYSLTGTTPSTAAGRISYTLGLQGPSLALDTACSSSLVALHLATRSLRERETDMALVGGVNLMLSPENHIAFSKLQAISPDGVCRTFSADANGYVRSEGCAMIVLKREADALRDGDPILAFLCGSAVNQDGKTNGLAAPNGQAQQAVIRSALSDAGITPEQVDYIEAHGTGTLLGDPIELEAIGQVMGGRQGEPLRIGSAKSNIGHMEPAAGLGGLIKIVLALKHQKIPANLHFTQPNPHVDWKGLSLNVVSEHQAWPLKSDPLATRYAGLSSFGFSGTNAHIVLAGNDVRQAQPRQPRTNDRSAHVLALSARSAASLSALARLYAHKLESTPASELANLCFSANTTRTPFEHRLSVVGSNPQHMMKKLAALADGNESATSFIGTHQTGDAGQCAWLFTGQGSEYPGMAQELYQTQPVFKLALDQCAAILDQTLPEPLSRILCDPDFDRLDSIEMSQPALFAFEYALAQLWLSWGIRPDLLAGHGVGEYAAACIAGMFSMEDGLRMITARARLMQAEPELEAIDKFKDLVSGIRISVPRITLISNSTGLPAQEDMTQAAYWVRQLGAPILFAETLDYLAQLSVQTYLEIGPNPDLLDLVRHHPHASHTARYCASLLDNKPASETLTLCAAQLFAAGLPIDWIAFEAPYPRQKIELPTYPFDRKRYWTNGNGPGRQSEQTRSAGRLVYRDAWVTQAAQRPALSFKQPSSAPWLLVGHNIQNLRGALETAGVGSVVLDASLKDLCDLSLTSSLLANALGEHGSFAGIAYHPEKLNLESDELPLNHEALALTHLARANLAQMGVPLWLLNECALKDDSVNTTGPVCALLLGLCRSLWIEQPRLRGGYVEYDANSVQQVAEEIIAAGSDDCVRFQSGNRSVMRLEPVTNLPAKSIDFHPEGRYLITGGLGALGLQAADQFARQGARHLILVGRNAPGHAALAQLEDIKRLGATVEIVPADISDARQMRALFEGIQQSAQPLRGIVHAAGVMQAHSLDTIELADINESLQAKVQGAWLLHRLSAKCALDFFVTYGSVSALTGTPELSLYTAANGFLEGLAHYRKSLGLPALCISWGVWQTGGVVDALASQLAQRSGFQPLDTAQALQALTSLPLTNEAHVAVVEANWKQVRAVFEARSPLTLLDSLVSTTPPQATASGKVNDQTNTAPAAQGSAPSPQASQAFQAALEQAAVRNRQPLMRAEILRCLSKVLQFGAEQQPSATIGFFDMGMDSIAATEFRLMLETETGCAVSQTDVFDYPTAETLSQFLVEQIFSAEKPVAASTSSSTKHVTVATDQTGDFTELTDEQLAALIEDEFNSLNQPDSKS